MKKPRHGHGRNMDPCIDCRILMLGKPGRSRAGDELVRSMPADGNIIERYRIQ